MTANEAAVRKAYQVAEDKDVAGWVNCFTKEGTFTDQSIGVTYRDSLDVLGCHPAPDVRRTVAKHNALADFKRP